MAPASRTPSFSTAFALVAIAIMAQGVAAETATATSTSTTTSSTTTTSTSVSLTPCATNCTIFTSSSAASLTGAGFFLLFLCAGAINFTALLYMNKADEAKYKIQLANAKMQQSPV